MIEKIQPCAVSVFRSKKNNKTYAKLWFPYNNPFVMGQPVESFFMQVDKDCTVDFLYNAEFLVAIDRGKIVAVDFSK